MYHEIINAAAYHHEEQLHDILDTLIQKQLKLDEEFEAGLIADLDMPLYTEKFLEYSDICANIKLVAFYLLEREYATI